MKISARSYQWLEDYMPKNEWITKKKIMFNINYMDSKDVDERMIRKYIEQYNKDYDAKRFPNYIVHSSKGYKITKSKEEILISLANNQRRALTMLKQNNRVRKSIKMKPLQQLEIGE